MLASEKSLRGTPDAPPKQHRTDVEHLPKRVNRFPKMSLRSESQADALGLRLYLCYEVRSVSVRKQRLFTRVV